jgi:hypothetical protein
LDASVPGYDGGDLTGDACKPLCGFAMESCHLMTCRGAPVAWCAMSCTGRRPSVLADAPPRGESLGAYFAELAYLEAASVSAFAELRRELAAHRAPPAILGECARAERDEIRHARSMMRFAQRFGASVHRPEAVRRRVRSLEAMAIHNAREGCVRETFGALVASWQARMARDPQVRRAMRAIARDERRHAALAWAIARWSDRLLSKRARARVRAALRAEARTLAQTCGAGSPTAGQLVAGVPTPQAAARLVSALERSLWTI